MTASRTLPQGRPSQPTTRISCFSIRQDSPYEYAFFAAPDRTFCGCDRDTHPNGRTRWAKWIDVAVSALNIGPFSKALAVTCFSAWSGRLAVSDKAGTEREAPRGTR
jgi:hypothetical protein